MANIIVIDTSMFCVWLKIPGFGNCGPANDLWDYDRINQKIEEEIGNESTLVLPIATIIETGNHISQCNGDRFLLGKKLCAILIKSIDNEDPWAAFSDQGDLWNEENIRTLADDWPKLAASRVSLGDFTIKDVASYYAEVGWNVEILTCDAGLKAFEPPQPPLIPRRRT